MNRFVIVAAAIVVFVIAVANVILGQHLILPFDVVETRGAGVPWYITWAMVWVSVACAVTLGLFLISAIRGKSPRH